MAHLGSVDSQQLDHWGCPSCHRHQPEPSTTAAENIHEPIFRVGPLKHRLVVRVIGHAQLAAFLVMMPSQMARISLIWVGLSSGALATSALICSL